ncbi:MAG: molecular chaperone TorD family protein [Acidobacteria bacterium]|nr:molecular chaperone TorD family protein [Acidobacteriota bacterium]
MRAPLPELLEALARIFGTPGALPRRAIRTAADSPWPGPKLSAALRRLVEAPAAELPVAYAGHFLYSSWEPVLHLEASVYRDGSLCDEDILQARDRLHRGMGVQPPPGRCPDHLASGLQILAAGLRKLSPLAPIPDREEALRAFIAQHLLPQVQGLQRVGAQRPLHPVFEGGLEVTEAVLEEILEALAQPKDRPSCTS